MRNALVRLRGDELAAHLMKGALGTGGLGLAHKTLSLVTAILLGRALGAEGYGYYAFAIAAVTFISIPAQLGIPSLATREIAASHARSEWSLMRGFRRRIAQTASFSIILGAILVGGALLAFADEIPALDVRTFAVALLLLPLYAGLSLMGSLLRGLRRVVQGTWPNRLLQPAVFVLLLLALAGGLSSQLAIALNVVSCAIGMIATAWLLRRYWPREASEAQPEYRTSAWLSSLLPFTLLAGINLLNQKTDIMMLGVFTSAADVGIYNVAIQGAMLVSFPLTVCNAVLAPNIARLHAQGDMRRMQRLMTVSTLAISIAAGAAALVIILAGEWLLREVFGDAFTPGYPALAILAIGQLLNAWAGSVGQFLIMTGHEKDTLKGVAVAAFLNVVLNSALIPFFGMIGAAIATAISLLTWNILLVVLVYKRLGLVAGPGGHWLLGLRSK